MNASITLIAATGPGDTTSARFPVRPLETADLPQLARLHQYAYAGQRKLGRAAASPDEGRTRIAEAASLVAYGPEGQIRAAIIITEADGEAVIDELFTHPDHRRQGLAEELLRHSMQVLHTLGRTTVTVTVEESNSAALALYLSRDFRRIPAGDSEYG
ncbi:GNAT family N-acetyltransferase [Pseudarthrobacter sp. NPDC080039]|uniref:GNAT family N-acetyltransferase n=1 Tax=unclassified Pseudarthrobacter TaxID=2647000 RepID=UPI00344BDA85